MGNLRFTCFGLLAAALLVGGCSLSPAVSPSPADASPTPSEVSPATPTALPPASAAPTPTSPPTPTSSPTPEVTPTADAARWELIATDSSLAAALNPDFISVGIVGFDGGYVAHGPGPGHVSFSSDGVQWNPVELPTFPPSCDESNRENLREAASTGDAVLIVGDYELANCAGELQTFAWASSDGRSWQRSGPIGSVRYELETDNLSLWPIPGGWEVAIGGDEQIEVWRSADGLSWQLAAQFSGFGEVLGAADADGTRLLSVYERRGSIGPIELVPVLLATSDDGTTWRQLDAPHRRAAAYGVVTRIVPPGGAFDDPWIVIVGENGQDAAAIGTSAWSSSDLGQWERVPHPDRWGTPCCGPSYPPLQGQAVGIVDGAAGTIAVLNDGRVYRLER